MRTVSIPAFSPDELVASVKTVLWHTRLKASSRSIFVGGDAVPA